MRVFGADGEAQVPIRLAWNWQLQPRQERLFVYLSIYPSIRPSIRLSICSFWLPVRVCVCQSRLSVFSWLC